MDGWMDGLGRGGGGSDEEGRRMKGRPGTGAEDGR